MSTCWSVLFFTNQRHEFYLDQLFYSALKSNGAFFKCANSFSDNFEPPSPFMQNDIQSYSSVISMFLLYGFKYKLFDSLSW